MPAVGLIFLIAILLPICWLVSEFRSNRALRITLGLACVAFSFVIAWFVGSLQLFSANAWFGEATRSLVDTTITELDRGHTDQVLSALKNLRSQYHPNYENRARYDELVNQAVQRMTQSPPPTTTEPAGNDSGKTGTPTQI
jgi:hypothetical protein